MRELETLKKLEGMHTLETVANAMNITKGSALNLISRLKKQGYITKTGGGKQKRIYKITTTKQRQRSRGMFDIINKYSPHTKLQPGYDHQVHGRYLVEDAVVDAICTQSFRVMLASIKLFNNVKEWPRLYKLAKERGVWQKVGALYDVARLFVKVRKMPERYREVKPKSWKRLTKLGNRNNFPEIQRRWKVYIPFNENDIKEVTRQHGDLQ